MFIITKNVKINKKTKIITKIKLTNFFFVKKIAKKKKQKY